MCLLGNRDDVVFEVFSINKMFCKMGRPDILLIRDLGVEGMLLRM